MGMEGIWGWDIAANVWYKIGANALGELLIDTDTLEILLTARLPATLDAGHLRVREQNWPADPSTGGRQDVQTDLISLIRILLTARLPAIISVNTATTGKQAIAAASTAVLAANAARIFAQFVNDSDEEIYLDLSDTAVMNEGIRLNAEGGSFEIGSTNLYTGAIAAICASGGKNLTVTEG